MEACFPPRQRQPFQAHHEQGGRSPSPHHNPLALQGGHRGHNSLRSCHSNQGPVPCWKSWMRKYIILCLLCGGLSVLLGVVFIIIYFILRSYTSSLQFFETIPTYVPAIVLIITGLVVMCFAKRRNRYTYLIKLAGGCCLVCALLCVVITVTTTVVHMNRLQMLHECIYTPKAKTCMCVSAIADPNAQDGAHRFIFNNTPNCEVVHGSLFACLRTLFGLSVIGILVCIFSSMLVYQLLTHEKKKTYWEQLELRRRFLYRRYPNHSHCSCCDDFYPWPLWDMLDYRLINMQRPSSPNPEQEDISPTSTVDFSSSNGDRPDFGSSNGPNGGRRISSSTWNWLPWNWARSRRAESTQRENAPPNPAGRENIIGRLMVRDGWNQLMTNSCSPVPQSPPGPVSEETEFSVGSPWRNECLHIFQTNNRNNGGVGPIRFGLRPRGNGGYGRPAQPWHRRTRSNDGVFHHLHLTAGPNGRCIGPPYNGGDAANCFVGYELPRYMWGPPPPYSQPTSIENVSQGLEHDQSLPLRPRDLGLPPPLPPRDMEMISSTSTHSGKSTPMSTRRLMCHDFTSESIRLTISGHFTDLRHANFHELHDPTQILVGDNDPHDETCIVEVHVPCLMNKQEVIFNTLPTRSSKKNEHNPFKSLSNIPLSFSRRLNSLKHDRSGHTRLSIIETCFEPRKMVGRNSTESFHCLTKHSCQESPSRTISEEKSGQENSTNSSNTMEHENMAESSMGFHTILELPSDFKSSIIIATSPSTPVTENVTLSEMIYAQSMPNLSVPNSPMACPIHRVPSSGNTSTSQDFADFELEEDSLPIIMKDTQECDVLSVTSLPDDDEQYDSISHNSGDGVMCFITEVPIQFREVPPNPPIRWESYQNCSSTSDCDIKPFRPNRFKRKPCDSEREDGCSTTTQSDSENPACVDNKTDFVITFKSINV